MLGQGTRNVLFQEGLAEVRDAMMRGEGLARPMSQTQLFPSAVVQMVRVGENTGTLDQQLEVGSRLLRAGARLQDHAAHGDVRAGGDPVHGVRPSGSSRSR